MDRSPFQDQQRGVPVAALNFDGQPAPALLALASSLLAQPASSEISRSLTTDSPGPVPSAGRRGAASLRRGTTSCANALSIGLGELRSNSRSDSSKASSAVIAGARTVAG